ncbi:MAG TPA: BatD family protein [Methylosinus sp.]|jgi:hypothetical protein|uniref:BatD family protein n=1 Tax=Methylosinus sp. TaxID=427 RepID=UPI002F927DD0
MSRRLAPLAGLALCLALASFAPAMAQEAEAQEKMAQEETTQQGRAQEEDAPVGRVEVRVELPAQTPYVGEPLRLVLRSAIRGRILLDHIIQPSLVDFDWQQFGVDSSSEEMIDGFWTPVVERVLMIYPLRAGRLTIPSFTRRIAYRIDESGRVETEFASAPFEIEARARDGLVPPGESFLPARSLRITDSWEPEPDKIPFGETARRMVTVEAEGITADRLPPLPNFRAPGIITFAAPVERRTIVTDQGPIARAVYRWSVRPVSSIAAFAPPIRIGWFDVVTRRMRESAAPERRVAFLETARDQAAARERTSRGLLAPKPLIAALASFVATIAVVFLLAALPRRALGRRPAALGALRRAASAGDVAAFRHASSQLAQADREGWRRIVAREDIGAPLAALDACLYGRKSATRPPPLALLARAIAAAWARDRRRSGDRR